MNIENKVVLITGSSRGIGNAIAREFVKGNAKVVVCGSKLENAKKAVEEIKKDLNINEDILLPVGINIKDSEDIKRVVEEVITKWGRIDVLINNAGITSNVSLLDSTDEEFKEMFDINFFGVVSLTREVVKHMKDTGGSIINTSSIVSFYGQGLGCMYPASKSAVNGLTRSLSRELGQYGIKVNSVAPGVTRTDMIAALPDSMVAPLLQKIPLARMGEAEDIANAALFLASDMASYITGAIIPVDGGAII